MLKTTQDAMTSSIMSTKSINAPQAPVSQVQSAPTTSPQSSNQISIPAPIILPPSSSTLSSTQPQTTAHLSSAKSFMRSLRGSLKNSQVKNAFFKHTCLHFFSNRFNLI